VYGFGADQGSSVVTFAGTEATVTSWSDTSIEVELPDVYPGDVPVLVMSEDGDSGSVDFQVILPEVIYLNSNLADVNDTIRAFAFSGDGGGSLAELDGSPAPLDHSPLTFTGMARPRGIATTF